MCVLSHSIMSNSLQSHDQCPAKLFFFHGISRLEYWSRLPFPTPGDLPDPGIKLRSLLFPTLAGRIFTTSVTWEAIFFLVGLVIK